MLPRKWFRISFIIILVLMLIIIASSAYADTVVRVSGISINNRELTLLFGEEAVFKATLTPRDATDQRIWWSNSNEKVLKLQPSGKQAYITALAPGEAVITAVSADGRFTVRSYVAVIKQVTSIGIDRNLIDLASGETDQLKAWVVPRDASEQGIIWESSDNAVAAVDAQGNVKAVREGEARIIARSLENRDISAYTAVRVVTAALGITTDLIEDPEQPLEEPPIFNDDFPGDESSSVNHLLYILIAALIVALAVFIILRRPARQSASKPLSAPVVGASGRLPVLRGISGLYAGSKFALNTGPLTIGRDQSIARVVYPQDYDQISRHHLTIYFDPVAENFLVEDTSSNGTYLSNGSRLQPKQVLPPGETLMLANTDETFVVELE